MPAQSRSALRRLIGAAVLAASVVGCTQLDAWQRQRSSRPNPSPRPGGAAGTEVFDLDVGGERVRAWYWQSPRADAPTVLYLHGARWNLNGAAFRIEGWTRMGYSVLAIDYRGFGASTPRLPSEATAQQDAVAGLRELARRQPTRRAASSTATAWAAPSPSTSRPAPQPPFAGLIVESSFTSIGAMLATMKWGKLPGASLLITQPFDSIERWR